MLSSDLTFSRFSTLTRALREWANSLLVWVSLSRSFSGLCGHPALMPHRLQSCTVSHKHHLPFVSPRFSRLLRLRPILKFLTPLTLLYCLLLGRHRLTQKGNTAIGFIGAKMENKVENYGLDGIRHLKARLRNHVLTPQ